MISVMRWISAAFLLVPSRFVKRVIKDVITHKNQKGEIFSLCEFANYLAQLFVRYLAYRCPLLVRPTTGLRPPLRPFDQLFCYLLQLIREFAASQIKTRFRSRIFLPVTQTTAYAK